MFEMLLNKNPLIFKTFPNQISVETNNCRNRSNLILRLNFYVSCDFDCNRFGSKLIAERIDSNKFLVISIDNLRGYLLSCPFAMCRLFSAFANLDI